MTNKIWTNPPIVYEVTNPSAHMIKRITKIVQSMFQLLSYFFLINLLFGLLAISFQILPISPWVPSIPVVIAIPVPISILALVSSSIPVISIGTIVAPVIPAISPRTATGCQHENQHCRPTDDSSESVHNASSKICLPTHPKSLDVPLGELPKSRHSSSSDDS